ADRQSTVRTQRQRRGDWCRILLWGIDQCGRGLSKISLGDCVCLLPFPDQPELGCRRAFHIRPDKKDRSCFRSSIQPPNLRSAPSRHCGRVPGMVTTTVKLNIRKGQPNSRATILQTVAVGARLEYINWTDSGEPVNGNSRWFQDANGNFFWSGGVRTT